MSDIEDKHQKIAARVKNLARSHDAHLTPMGDVLCNLFSFVLMDLYSFAETLPESHKTNLLELIKSKEDFPRNIIELGNKVKKKDKGV